MITTKLMSPTEQSDTELVAQSVAGSHGAFGQIVARYQTLICSLAYSATGSLTQSEDLSQETFVAAWKQLPDLREPGKLRSWLCAIVRNLSRRNHRGQQREPSHAAESLENVHETTALETHPLSEAITREEEAILWRSLERIPETYREPLILFYREDQSIENVAAALELSEDAVRQRLTRGRRLLQDEVQTFVEITLRRSVPDKSFSSAVLSALPLAAGPAATAGVSVGVKGAAATKTGLVMAILTPFLGVIAGFSAQWVAINASTTGKERKATRVKLIVAWAAMLLYSVGGQVVVQIARQRLDWDEEQYFLMSVTFWWSFAMFALTWIVIGVRRGLEKIQASHQSAPMLRPPLTPMPPFKLAMVIIGTHLMVFMCVIYTAFRSGDTMMGAIILGIMAVMCVWQFINKRGKSGLAYARGNITELAAICAVVIAILNLRLDVWLATIYHLSVPAMHARYPLWLIPAETLVLVVWTGTLMLLTRPKTV
jgi:RNA polymerase sigma factor (sigma-70 family)